MTIQMLRTWNGLEEESIYTLAPAEETRLIGLGLARAFVDGMDGVSDGSGTGQASVSVSGGGTQIDRLAALMRAGKPIPYHIYGNSISAAGGHIYGAAGRSGGRFAFARNSSISGYKSPDVLTKLLSDGLHPLAKMMLFQEGTNDSAVAGFTAAQHRAAMEDIAQYAIDRGVVPLLILVPPSDITTTGRQAKFKSFYMAELMMAERMGIPAYDAFARFRDTDGTWTAGASTDQIHPVSLTYDQAGIDFWNLIEAGKPAYLLPYNNDGEGTGYLGTNVLGLTDTNSDNLPDGWSLIGATGHAISPRTDYAFPFRGKRASVSISQSTSVVIQRVSGTPAAANGDVLRCTGILGLSGLSNCRVTIYLRANGTGIDYYLGSFSEADLPDIYMSTEFQHIAGTTQYQLTIKTEPIVAGAYTATVAFGSWDLHNLTAYSV